MSRQRGRSGDRPGDSSGSARPHGGDSRSAGATAPGHVVPTPVYLAIFAALLLLTAATVQVAFLDLGRLNLLVAISIAVIKATLVVLYFMHARYGGAVVWVFIGAGIFWLAILVAITLSDYLAQGWLPGAEGWA